MDRFPGAYINEWCVNGERNQGWESLASCIGEARPLMESGRVRTYQKCICTDLIIGESEATVLYKHDCGVILL